MRSQTHYSILGIAPGADRQTVRAAYKAQMMKYHPDKYRADPARAEAISKSLNQALFVLDDPNRRAEYDRSIGLLARSASPFAARGRNPAAGNGSLAARLLRPEHSETKLSALAGSLAGLAMLVWLSST